MGFRLVEVAPGRAVFEGEAGAAPAQPARKRPWRSRPDPDRQRRRLRRPYRACRPGVGYTTVETKVNFTRPIAPDGSTIRCEGRVVTRGRQIATAEARLLSADGKILAHGTSTLIILPPRG